MKVTRRNQLQLRIQNFIFTVLLITIVGLLAWLSMHYKIQSDWTLDSRHTLSEMSKQTLEQLTDPVEITAYIGEVDDVRLFIKELVNKYQQVKPDLSLTFIDPDTVPAETRQLGVAEGQLIIHYQARTEHVLQLDEESLTTALQRVAKEETHYIAFLEGHGERSPHGVANHDFGDWGAQLEARGFKVQGFNFSQTTQVPDNSSTLVIANPQVKLLDTEVQAINAYLTQGGNLLWLFDPGEPLQGLEPIAEKLGLTIEPGVIVSASAIDQLYGVQYPTQLVLAPDHYRQDHPITEKLLNLTLFPQACGLKVDASPDIWDVAPILTTHNQTWSETGETFEYEEDKDSLGPFDIGFTMTRVAEQGEDKEQRIVLIGDGDFLSNTFIANGGNLDLGIKIINWLAREDIFISIPAKIPSDASLELSSLTVGILGMLFLVILPLGLISAGIIIWLQRRKA